MPLPMSFFVAAIYCFAFAVFVMGIYEGVMYLISEGKRYKEADAPQLVPGLVLLGIFTNVVFIVSQIYVVFFEPVRESAFIDQALSTHSAPLWAVYHASRASMVWLFFRFLRSGVIKAEK